MVATNLISAGVISSAARRPADRAQHARHLAARRESRALEEALPDAPEAALAAESPPGSASRGGPASSIRSAAANSSFGDGGAPDKSAPARCGAGHQAAPGVTNRKEACVKRWGDRR
jgi:hypothetical protein